MFIKHILSPEFKIIIKSDHTKVNRVMAQVKIWTQTENGPGLGWVVSHAWQEYLIDIPAAEPLSERH